MCSPTARAAPRSCTTCRRCGSRPSASPAARSTRSTRRWWRRCAVADRVAVVLVTGFLGSGKTTLIAALLRHPELRDAAVLVNELGEAAIDHHLVRQVDERTVVMGNGCVCCTLRGDLRDELRELLARRDRGGLPPFHRVVVETTGLADPAPVLSTLLTEPVLRHQFAIEAVVVTVDAVHGAATLERHAESVKQVAVADTLILTKGDAAAPGACAALVARLRLVNPAAAIHRAEHGAVAPAVVLGGRDGHVAAPTWPPPRSLGREAAHAHDVGAF